MCDSLQRDTGWLKKVSCCTVSTAYFFWATLYIVLLLGAADCPHYAKVELLAEQLASNLSEFKLHKIVKLPHEWSVSDWNLLFELLITEQNINITSSCSLHTHCFVDMNAEQRGCFNNVKCSMRSVTWMQHCASCR